MIIGNARNESISEIWNSSTFNHFRIDMLRGQKCTICKSCNQLKAGMPVSIDGYESEILGRM
jgi:MoaA/NifB/PqqE/SkfB family radical SAM enzyme